MVGRIKKISRVFTVLYFLFCVGTAMAEDFSADIVSKTKEGVCEGKVFATKDKIRMEMKGVITISRLDKNVVWMLMPAEKTYMESPLNSKDIVIHTDKIPGEITRELVSREQVDGKMTDKYKVVYILYGKKECIFVWMVNDSKFPIKTSAVDGSWIIEYKNIVVGKKPDSLFEIPAGYEKFSYRVPDMFGETEE